MVSKHDAAASAMEILFTEPGGELVAVEFWHAASEPTLGYGVTYARNDAGFRGDGCQCTAGGVRVARSSRAEQ